MPVIEVLTTINAAPELCFDLARDIQMHIESTAGTGEVAVSGVTNGLMELGDEVTWEATHFGVRQKLTSRMTRFDRPRHFRDSQVRGAFNRFDHDHFFTVESGRTIMQDVFDYESPLGLLGHWADRCFLRSYMTKLLKNRALVIKTVAEARTETLPTCFR